MLLSEVFKIMHRLDHHQKPVHFQIGFFTADLRRNTGGDYMEVKHAVLAKLISQFRKFYGNEAPRFATPQELLNQTITLYDLVNECNVTVHWGLIWEFNYERVKWDSDKNND